MGINNNLVLARNKIFDIAGTQIRLRYYDPVYDDVYDEATGLVQSGNNLWTSGIVFPVKSDGSDESVLMSQGKLTNTDSRLYVNGSLSFAGSIHMVDIQIGSPTGDLYTTILDGGITWDAEGTPVYKKQFIRRLTGSLNG